MGKKSPDKVYLIKDFVTELPSTSANIFLTKEDMKFGDLISKPTDYWYELELNPDTFPDTFVGYGEDGPALFRLYPEAKDVVEGEIEDEKQNSAVERMVVNFVYDYLNENADATIEQIVEQYMIENPVDSTQLRNEIYEYVRSTLAPEDIGAIQSPAFGAVGEALVVTSVDSNGKPNAWGTAKVGSGNGSNGSDGANGAGGVTFIPTLDDNGNLSWRNNGGMDNPPTVNIKGPKGEKGDTPEKGVDYLTETEIIEVTNNIFENGPKLKAVEVEEAETTTTISYTMEDDTPRTDVMHFGSDVYPTKIVADGKEIPVTWRTV
jgi:hypothetical protein